MENRAFSVELSDELESSESSTPLVSSSVHVVKPEPETACHSMSTTKEDPFVSSEHQPININRPIFYSANFYPSLQAANRRQCDVFLGSNINDDPFSATQSSNVSPSTSPTFNSSKRSSNKQLSNITKRFRAFSNANSVLPCSSCCSVFETLFPILSWLPKYKLSSDLLADLITGFTILALHIPQGLAYGRLAGVESINGLYVSLFPVILYAVFGGSRHISMGTFAVICIACKDVLDTFDAQGLVIGGHHYNETRSLVGQLEPATKIEVLTSLCLLVGLIQFLLGFFRLGILATLFSDPIISAFIVACSLHVFTSQVFALFGVSSAIVPENEPNIPFDLVKKWYRLFCRLHKANIPTVIISSLTITSLVLCKKILEPFLIKKFNAKNITIPIDIIAIATLTTLSYFFNFNAKYNVAIIPKLSDGFQGMPIVPRLDLWPKLFTSAILISFIAYAATYTLAKVYAKKHQYEVYPNQELIALGVANMVSSFLLCFPASGSLARSAVQEKVGGRTQLASLISSGCVVIFLLFLSHLLDSLPNCVLACIIVVALRSTMSQFTELFYYWKISKYDGLVWIGTFLLVVLFGVANGLLYGLVIGLLFLIFRTAMPQFNLKYHVAGSECYLPTRELLESANLSNGSSNKHFVVFDYHGPLIFLNVERFKTKVEESVLRLLKNSQKYCTNAYQEITDENQATTSNGESNKQSSCFVIVFDMGRVSYVDNKAVECLLELNSELAELNSTLLLAGPSEQIIDSFIRCEMFDSFKIDRCFLTVYDAVCYVKK